MLQLNSKLPDIGTTIFTIMSKMAADHGAINLSQGYPDFSCPPELINLVTEAMQQGFNQYPPMAGVEELRIAIAKKVKLVYATVVDPIDEITVVSGATEGLFNAITTVIHAGDEAIIFEPAYDAYEPVIRLAGGKTSHIAMRFPDYSIDWDQVSDAVNDKTRLIMINTPHNPTGAILRQNDIDALTEIIKNRNIFIISDEVYEHIIFDDHPHLSMLRYPQLRERSFVISSFGKTYHTTGWKIGYCIAPAALTDEFRKIHQFNTFSTNSPIQVAYGKFLQNTEHYMELPLFYQAKRDHLLNVMADSRFHPLDCHGTYFQSFDYSEISNEPDIDLVKRMTKEFGVAAIPVSVFYSDQTDNKVIRICFAKDEKTLTEAAKKLSSL